MQSGGSNMEYPATITIHGPKGPVDACDRHAEQIKHLMSIMGVHCAETVADQAAECPNCVNEAKVRSK